MKIREVTRGILTILRNCERSSSRWPLVAAFIAGAVLTAAVAPTLIFTHPENIVPIPQDAPKLYEPGAYPANNPAEHYIAELVYAFPEEALISG